METNGRAAALCVALRIEYFKLYWFFDTFFANPDEPLLPNGGNEEGGGNTPVGGGAPIGGGIAVLRCLSAA